MWSTVISIYSLLAAVAILLLGSGYSGTLIGVRAGMEGFSDTVNGIIMSGYFVGFVTGAFLCPRLLRLVGHIRAVAAMAALASASITLHGLIVQPVIWLLLRIVTGACMVGLYLAIESWLNSLLERRTRGRIFAVYMLVNLMALGTAQYLILVYGPVEIAGFALAAAFFALGLIPIALTRVPEPAKVATPTFSLSGLLKLSRLASAGAFATGLTNGTLWGLGALYAHRIGFDPAGIAAFMSAVIFGGALLQLPIGYYSDRHDRRKVLLFAGALAFATACALALVPSSSLPTMLAAAFFYGGFSFSVYSLSVAHANDRADTAQTVEVTRGLLLVNGTGAAIGPVVSGILMHNLGPRSMMMFFAVVFLALAAYALLRVRVSNAVPIEDQAQFMPVARTSPAAAEIDPRNL
jgi:MFS family permease